MLYGEKTADEPMNMHIKSAITLEETVGIPTTVKVTGVLAIRAVTGTGGGNYVQAIGVFETVPVYEGTTIIERSLIFFRSSEEDGSILEVFAAPNHKDLGCGDFMQNWLSVPTPTHVAATTIQCSTGDVLVFDYNTNSNTFNGFRY